MSLRFEFDETAGVLRQDGLEISLASPRAFELLSKAWLRAGWETKYVYGFTWLGRPVIQLPEDMLRIQEVIYDVKPDIIVETGVAHGGSLVFYASLCTAVGKGRVIGIDIDIRPANRKAIEDHRLSPLISLVQGSSTDASTVQSVREQIREEDSVLVILDSNHSKDHVLAELEAFSPLVSLGSFIVVCDGIMQDVVGASRTEDDWGWNNPISAINEFLEICSDFEEVEPSWPFNEGSLQKRVTYWPRAFLRRTKSTFQIRDTFD